MKMKMIMLFVFALAVLSSSVQAATLVSYDSGVAAELGAVGAADPTTQGWATSPGVGANGWTTPLDSGNGGWRVIDGTSQANCYYEQTLNSHQAAAMTGDWTATFTVASNGDLINATTGLDNFMSGTTGRQTNNAMWIEQAGGYRYILSVEDYNGTMSLYNGTGWHDLTGHGWSQEIGAETPVMDFVTLTLSYDAATDTATLSEGATSYGTVPTWGAGTVDRVIFGATSSGGLGSTTWNAVTVVPEPATMLLLGLGGLVLRRRSK